MGVNYIRPDRIDNEVQIFGNYSIDKNVMKEILKEAKQIELRLALSKIESPDQIVIQPYSKKSFSFCSSSKGIKKESRASKFRGVSRNGVQWQVQLGNTLSKRYIGSAPSEEEAARLYDRKAILTNGLKAKTNYTYTKRQIEYILDYGKLWALEC